MRDFEFTPKISSPFISVQATGPSLFPNRSLSPSRFRNWSKISHSHRDHRFRGCSGPGMGRRLFPEENSSRSPLPPASVHCPPSGLPAGTRGWLGS